MRISQTIALGITAILALASCQGPRNIYSAVPFASPVPLKNGQVEIGVDYSSNKSNFPSFQPLDTLGNSDKGYGLSFGKMCSSNLRLMGFANLKNEKNTLLYNTDSFIKRQSSAIFDSGVILTNRKTLGIGAQIFSNAAAKTIYGLSGILQYQGMRLKESGLDKGRTYSRYFNMGQILLTGQGSILFKLSKSFNLSYVSRLSFCYYLPSNTNYTPNEKFSSGLNKDGGIGAYLNLFGLYADIQPLKNVPIVVMGQWYNDWTSWNFDPYEDARKHIKGSGGSLGFKYLFRPSHKPR